MLFGVNKAYTKTKKLAQGARSCYHIIQELTEQAKKRLAISEIVRVRLKKAQQDKGGGTYDGL